MSTEKLVAAIVDGDAQEIQAAFSSALSSKLLDKIDDLRADTAQTMFNFTEEKQRPVVHVKPIRVDGQLKYKLLGFSGVSKNDPAYDSLFDKMNGELDEDHLDFFQNELGIKVDQRGNIPSKD